MVIFQDTVTHPLPAWNIFCGFDIVCVIWYLSNKNYSGIFVYCIIWHTISLNVISMIYQFLNGLLWQAASRLMPEFNWSAILFYIIIPKPHRKRIEQKFCIGFPSMTLRQCNIPIAQCLCPGIHCTKICSLYASHQFRPNLWINDPIKIQTVLSIIVKRGSHTHLTWLEPCLVIQVI